MIKKTSSNQPSGRDSEYISCAAFLKSFSIFCVSISQPWQCKANLFYVLLLSVDSFKSTF